MLIQGQVPLHAQSHTQASIGQAQKNFASATSTLGKAVEKIA